MKREVSQPLLVRTHSFLSVEKRRCEIGWRMIFCRMRNKPIMASVMRRSSDCLKFSKLAPPLSFRR